MPAAKTDPPVLFFDGVCNFCNSAVQFVIRHDREGKVRFAPLQSPAGEKAREAVARQIGSVPDSLILRENGEYYVHSSAALRLAAHLDGGWRSLRHLVVFPRFLRDGVYRLVARNRYRLWGKRDACMIPTPDLRARFLSGEEQ